MNELQIRIVSRRIVSRMAMMSLLKSALRMTIWVALLAGVILRAPALMAETVIPPVDELALFEKGLPRNISHATGDVAGVWGKCVDSVSSRCFYLDISVDGLVSTFTYVGLSQDKSSDQPTSDQPAQRCYNHTSRQLLKLGGYTYIWQDQLSDSFQATPDDLMKISINQDTLYIFKGDQLEFSMPAVSLDTRAEISPCR